MVSGDAQAIAKVNFDVYTSSIDGALVVHIDTTDDIPTNHQGPMMRVYINDDTDNPIWNNV